MKETERDVRRITNYLSTDGSYYLKQMDFTIIILNFHRKPEDWRLVLFGWLLAVHGVVAGLVEITRACPGTHRGICSSRFQVAVLAVCCGLNCSF